MRRVETSADLWHDDRSVSLHQRSGFGSDPLEDESIPLSEKHRIAGMWEIVRSYRHNPSQMIELLRPKLVLGMPAPGAPSIDRVQIPVSSALQLACMYGDLHFTKMLVSRGESINQVIMSPDNFGRGRCCSSVAAELGHNSVLQFLVSAGADVKNIHDPPLRQAVRRNDLAAVTMLVNAGADPDPTLHQLLYPGCDVSVIRMLLEAGARPSGTMLLTALWRGCDIAVIELLLMFGAPFRSDLENESALEVAICRGAGRRVVDLLLRAGSRWSPKTHKMYPKVFRERAFQMCLVNQRLPPRLRLPPAVVQRIIWWTGTAEKHDGDYRDLTISICNSCDIVSLEHRISSTGFGEIARKSELSGNTSKAALLEGMAMKDLLKLLWFDEKLAPIAPPTVVMPPMLIDATTRMKLMQSAGSESTLESRLLDDVAMDEEEGLLGEANARGREDEDGGDMDGSSNERSQRKVRKLNIIPVGNAGSYFAEASALPPSVTADRAGGSGSNRRTAHPVADVRNPNSPKPHHCTCCHVCHVSMKQRPRPIAACAQCNTIICKLCLQDRWKSDQWSDACSSAGWICHKCAGTCVCKACKSKGARGPEKPGVVGMEGIAMF